MWGSRAEAKVELRRICAGGRTVREERRRSEEMVQVRSECRRPRVFEGFRAGRDFFGDGTSN